MVKKFAGIDLHPDRVSNREMGYVFEELIRRFGEARNEQAGDHFTPREVIRLMVNLLFEPDSDALQQPGVVRTAFDPAAGTGGMLSVAEEYLPLDEQRVIAAFLEMKKMQRLIELLEEKRSALISRAVTKGLNADVPMRDSGVEWLELISSGPIPNHWVSKALEICGGADTRGRESALFWHRRFAGLETQGHGIATREAFLDPPPVGPTLGLMIDAIRKWVTESILIVIASGVEIDRSGLAAFFSMATDLHLPSLPSRGDPDSHAGPPIQMRLRGSPPYAAQCA